MKNFLPFVLLVLAFLLGTFYLVNGGAGLTTKEGSTLQAEATRECGEKKSHKVQYGDTCWAIAEDNNLSVQLLEEVNLNLNCDSLRAGEVICIPT
jgi:LysM repeat protein